MGVIDSISSLPGHVATVLLCWQERIWYVHAAIQLVMCATCSIAQTGLTANVHLSLAVMCVVFCLLLFFSGVPADARYLLRVLL